MNVLIAARVIAGMGGGGSVPQFYVSFRWLQLTPLCPQSYDWCVAIAIG